MKKLVLLVSIITGLAVAASAQTEDMARKEIKTSKTDKKEYKPEEQESRKTLRKLHGEEVSGMAKHQFAQDFGNAMITGSERTSNFDEFTFYKDGLVTRAFYDIDSRLVGTTQKKSFTDLPPRAQKRINMIYKEYQPVAVILFEDNKANTTDMILYDTRFEDADSYFVELQKADHKFVAQVNTDGDVSYFTRLK